MSDSLPIEIDVQSVHSLRQSSTEFLLLDCRETDEWNTARIDGAVLIPMSGITESLAQVEPYRKQRIVVHCHHGGRSLRVTRWLRQQGFDQAQNMTGGIDAWSEKIDPQVPRYQ